MIKSFRAQVALSIRDEIWYRVPTTKAIKKIKQRKGNRMTKPTSDGNGM